MKNFTKKASALVLTALFATMQFSFAATDTGLGAGIGGAVINNTTGGFAGIETGTNSATLKFNGDTHVNWQSLNVNSGETLNFNAVDGVKGISVLNTVNQGMSTIYGQINANDGIARLIIANPNGVLFDGAKFITTGDALITTQALDANFANNQMTVVGTGQPITGVVSVLNSEFSVGGNLNFVGDTIDALKSAFNTKDGAGTVKFRTTNGQDYMIVPGSTGKTPVTAVKLDAISVDGDVYIVTNKGQAKVENGGYVSGNLKGEFGGDAYINENTNYKMLLVDKDVNIDAHGSKVLFRHSAVKGNADITNDGGYVDIGTVNVKGDVNLTTKKLDNISDDKYNHFVHVVGDNTIGGDLNIDSAQNIHIGGYKLDSQTPKVDNGDGTFYYHGKLNNGYLNVAGDLNAKTTSGHITTTVNTTAKNIKYEANSTNNGTRNLGGNILTDGKAVLTAETYDFKADGYIGGLKENAIGRSVDDQIINIMETYTQIPANIASHDYMTVAGGTITNIQTPKVTAAGNDVQVYIKSNGDVVLTGANAGDINMTAPSSKITVTGDVHAKEINVGPETDYLKLDFEGRDFTTNFTNIRDEKIVTVRPDEVITYELTDGQGGHNQPTLVPGEKTTYLIGPDAPQPPVPPTPDPKKPTTIDNNDNAKLLKNWVPEDPMAAPVNTPVAFAADLDDDEEAAGVRKNVDGSVTVVRAFPMGK